ncbi:MAG: hypothetical protein U0821_10095 [Chloroflexota bacterium]
MRGPVTQAMCFLMTAVVTLASPLTTTPASADSDLMSPLGEWRQFGPAGPRAPTAIGVSSSWPEDSFVYASYGPSNDTVSIPGLTLPAAVRTYDGGRTWETLDTPAPPGDIAVLLTRQQGRVLIAFPSPDWTRGASHEASVFRSEDDGATWARDATGLSAKTARLIVSPDVFEDSRLILAIERGIFESHDAGATWAPARIDTEQTVTDVQFSPDFAKDRTMFAVVNSEPLVYPFYSPNFTASRRAHEESVGLLKSTDAGRTWSQLTKGLAADGVPFRQIAELAVSPTFAADATLYATAWGPWDPRPGSAALPRIIVLRSTDAGESWQPVFGPHATRRGTAYGWTGFFRTTIRLSREYATDQTLLITINGSGGSPASGSCTLLGSTDAGTTWTPSTIVSSYGGCWGLELGGEYPVAGTVRATSSGSRGWQPVSARGTSQNIFAARLGRATAAHDAPRAAARDGTLFIGARGGVWAVGPSTFSLGETARQAGCMLSDGITTTRARAASTWTAHWQGCPLENETDARVAFRRLGPVLGLWIEDGVDGWEEVVQEADGSTRVSRIAGKPGWADAPDTTMEGTVQRLHGGAVITLLPTQGAREVISIAYPEIHWWREPAAP